VRAELPVDRYLPDIVRLVGRARALVLTAAPGAGKTTRVAPALAADGPTLLLQPRRVAARAIARHIADERGWTLGHEVGWQVRFERRFGPSTRLLVATEGILAARAQADPLLSDFRTIVIDEFHERSIHADLALAFARQARLARDDLRLVVMSATLETDRVSAYLGGCPVIVVPGRVHPVRVSYRPDQSIRTAVGAALESGGGQVLCFLPGAPEIGRAAAEIEMDAAARGIDVVPLHGSLPAAAQDEAVRPAARRRVILATNIAETSLTVPGVTAVVDSGYQKVVRFDVSRGIDSLETERIPADSAEQRAGRAGRTAPGLVVRLWDERDRLRPAREPDIDRIDLSGLVLDVLAWGGDPETFEWFDAPRPERLDAAWELLGRLGAVAGRRLTPLGERVRRIPLHPRLACILIAAGGAPEAAAACALLSERHAPARADASTTCDLWPAIDRWHEAPPHLAHAAREFGRLAGGASGGRRRAMTEHDFRRALLAGYPDRVARRRSPGSPRVVLASGHGAVLTRESGVRDGAFLVAIDVVAGAAPARGARPGESADAVEARIRVASRIEREWIAPDATRTEHRFDREAGIVRAVRQQVYDRLVIAEHAVAPDPGAAARLLVEVWLERGPSPGDEQVLRRIRFAGMEVDLRELAARACDGCRSLDDVRIESSLSPDLRSRIERDAPATLLVPSGRRVGLEYRADGGVGAAVKLQELFGLADTPRLGPRREPVLIALLAPNGRPVQLTRDLRSFWDRLYPDVRKELRGRYPKHPWPENPWAAAPTGRTTRRQ
jgi:ATP-dependent helicase HrpB